MGAARGFIPTDCACGDGSIDVKGTELNDEKCLKIRCFREVGVRLSSVSFDNKIPLPYYENKG